MNRNHGEADESVERDPVTGTYRTTYQYPSEPPSTTVALALMEITDSDATELDPLYTAAGIDTDALDAMFAPGAGEGRSDEYVRFTAHGHTVVVESDGRIVISPEDSSADALANNRS